MKKGILLAILAGLLSVFVAAAAACATEDEPQTIETNVTASTVRDDMTISVTAQAESFDGMQCTLYYGETLIESVAAAGTLSFEAPHHGIYTIRLENAEGVVKQTEAKVWASEYRIAYFNATLPVTMFMTSVFSDQSENLPFLAEEGGMNADLSCKLPTYIYLERTQTFDWEQLPANAYQFPGEVDGFWEDMEEAYNFIKELYAMDSSSKFYFNFADNYTMLTALFAWGNQIPDANYTVTAWTDGQGSYTFLNALDSTGKYTALQEQVNAKKAEFLAETPDFSELYAYVSDQYADSNGGYGAQMALVLANETENVHYILNSTEGITWTDEALRAKLEGVDAVALNDMLSLLKAEENAAGFRAFEFLYQTRWVDEDGREQSYSDIFAASEKPNLIILGTSVSGEAVSASQPYSFERYYTYLQENYGDEYDIYYKAHPSYPITSFTDGRAEWFERDGVVDITPAQIPVELFMFFYEDVYVCGYFGSSFYSSQDNYDGQGKDQTVCFFATQAAVLTNTTLKAMYDEGYFSSTVFLGDVMAEQSVTE